MLLVKGATSPFNSFCNMLQNKSTILLPDLQSLGTSVGVPLRVMSACGKLDEYEALQGISWTNLIYRVTAHVFN